MDFFCSYEHIGHSIHQCKKCGRKIRMDAYSDPIPVPCPSFFSIDKHGAEVVSDTMQTHLKIPEENRATPEEIEKRHNICKSCDKFKDNMCKLCGCYITRAQEYNNKLASRSESCPIKKW